MAAPTQRPLPVSARPAEPALPRRLRRRGLLPLLGSTLVATGCASVPKGQYGVDSLELEGADQLSEAAIKRCLLTTERDSFGITLGLPGGACGEPPFEDEAPRIELFHWPWTDWPGLNAAVLEVDRERVERFYRARGFYDARVLEVRYEPAHAGHPEREPAAGQCDPRAEECTVEITIVVEEGSPLRIGELRIEGAEHLPGPARELLAQAELPEPGQRFDELDYDRGKERLAEQLAEASYAEASVEGEVRLDHEQKLAHVTYRVEPGPAYRFGEVRVSGQGALPKAPIVAAADIESGQPFRQGALLDVQREVYALGAFSAVEVEREIDAKARQVHLRVKVTPLSYDAFRLGIGVTSGVQHNKSGQSESIPQWDVHLLARYERRHVFGTLGKLRVEERPRLIFQKPFPEPADPRLGNLLRLRLSEPGLVEAHTELWTEGTWDYGPDPYLGFLRSDISLQLGAERPFLRRTLFATVALQHDRFLVAQGTSTSDGSPVPDGYVYSFLKEELRLDLRDNAVQPRRGALLSLSASQSVRAPFSDWTTLLLSPDARVYLPLPFYMVLAARFALGALFVLDARPDLDEDSLVLGPASYRLRGGGAQSNRGFVAGELGAGPTGGLRRWESSVELRIRLGEAFGVVTFFDMGDVNRGESFRFNETNPSAGFGLRYLTPLGAFRVDVGFRLEEPDEEEDAAKLFGTPGALHLTIGEAF